MIYAVEAQGLSLVKIGKAKNVAKRMKALQTACPAKLELLAAADWPDELECDLHHYLDDCHAHGEWFHRSERLDKIIGLLRQGSHLEMEREFLAAAIRGEKYAEGRLYTKLHFRDWHEGKHGRWTDKSLQVLAAGTA